MRDMSRRLATKRVSRAASSSIEASRSSRWAGAIVSPNWRNVVTAPVIEASGVRRSCDSEESSVVRSFSFSSSAAVFTESLTSSARSMAIAVCSRMRLSARSRSGEIAACGSAGSKPQTPPTPRVVTSGRNWKRTLGSVPVRQPAGFALLERPARRARLAGIELVDRRPRGGKVQFAILRQHHDHAARAERLVHVDGRRQKDVVERRRARQFARQFVDRLGRAGIVAHALRLVARAAGEQAGENRHDQKDQQREEFLRLGDREFVARVDEEEIIGEERQDRGDDRRTQAELHRAEQHRGQKDHRQIGQMQPDVESR